MANRTFLFDKLVRDNIIDLFEKDGAKTVSYQIEDNEEFLDAITQKLIEELEEVFNCESKEEVIKELGDFEEVLTTFKKLLDISPAEIAAAQKEKTKEKGGFNKRIYLETVTFPKNHPMVKYYLKNEEKYPEVDADEAAEIEKELKLR